MSIDVIADFLTIIRNGVMVSKSFVTAPYSKMRHSIAQILKNEGFITDFVILEIQRVSKPGRRVYAGNKEIKPVIGQLGISILTTSHGVMAHQKAKQLSVGGEVICTVW